MTKNEIGVVAAILQGVQVLCKTHKATDWAALFGKFVAATKTTAADLEKRPSWMKEDGLDG